jgi:hypothetical protein
MPKFTFKSLKLKLIRYLEDFLEYTVVKTLALQGRIEQFIFVSFFIYVVICLISRHFFDYEIIPQWDTKRYLHIFVTIVAVIDYIRVKALSGNVQELLETKEWQEIRKEIINDKSLLNILKTILISFVLSGPYISLFTFYDYIDCVQEDDRKQLKKFIERHKNDIIK